MQDIFTNIKSDMWLLLVGGGGVEYFFSDFQIRSTDFFFFFYKFYWIHHSLCSKGHNTDLHIINNEIKSHVKKNNIICMIWIFEEWMANILNIFLIW